MKKLITILSACVLVPACEAVQAEPKADTIRTQQTEQLMREASRQVPAPAISNFQQLRWQTYLYELQDNAISTHSYTTTLDGTLIYLCPSVGYGMNASVQITNPERVAHQNKMNGGSFGTLPQPEPNGLFMPEGLASTYVMCADRNGDGEPDPLYVESEVLVSLVELPFDKSWWASN